MTKDELASLEREIDKVQDLQTRFVLKLLVDRFIVLEAVEEARDAGR